MEIRTENLVSISEANQNFSKVARMVEENGDVVILKNNKPEFLISKFDENKIMSDSDVLELVARRILSEHKRAFEELAKWDILIKIKFYFFNNL